MKFYTQRYSSPGGELLVVVDEDGAVVYLALPNGHQHWASLAARRRYTLVENSLRCAVVVRQLEEYFEHKRTVFDLPLKPDGTPFQQAVWSALIAIPFGATVTYKELAERIGKPAAIRAVGRANGTNPIPIIIPCHRVIGTDGSLTGFGGGLALKEFLLTLEGVNLKSFSKNNTSQQLQLL